MPQILPNFGGKARSNETTRKSILNYNLPWIDIGQGICWTRLGRFETSGAVF
jgi:hypothetical protein